MQQPQQPQFASSSSLLPRPSRSSSTSSIPSARLPPIPPKPQPPLSIVNDHVQKARAAFSRKEYPVALEFLTKALEFAPEDINLLDSRSASYEKLGDLNRALVDAKSMIRHHPLNAKSYLRTGRVLRLMKDIKMAEKVYKAGLRKCARDNTNKDFEALQKQLDIVTATTTSLTEIATTTAASPPSPKERDPMEVLPFEMIRVIFDLLPFRTRVLCTGVNKRWRANISSVLFYWREIDLGVGLSLQRSSSVAECDLYLPIHQLRGSNRTNPRVDNKVVLACVRYSPPVSLLLGNAPNLTNGLLTALVKAKMTTELQHFSLRMCSRIVVEEVTLLLKNAPKLKTVDLYGSVNSNLAHLVIKTAAKWCKDLEELNLVGCSLGGPIVDPGDTLEELIATAPPPTKAIATESAAAMGMGTIARRLKKLSFGEGDSDFALGSSVAVICQGVHNLAHLYPNLTYLDFTRVQGFEFTMLLFILPLSQLSHLYLDGSSHRETNHADDMASIREKMLILMMRSFPKMRSFQISGCKWWNLYLMLMLGNVVCKDIDTEDQSYLEPASMLISSGAEAGAGGIPGHALDMTTRVIDALLEAFTLSTTSSPLIPQTSFSAEGSPLTTTTSTTGQYPTRPGWAQSLESLDISRSVYLVGLDVFLPQQPPMTVYYPNLHTLIVNQCSRLVQASLCRFLKLNGSKLVRFEGARLPEITDQVLETLADHCACIRYVNLSSNPRLTGAGVLKLVRTRAPDGGLDYLCLDGCEGVGVDAVERARELLGGDGRKVSFVFSRSNGVNSFKRAG